MGQHMEKVAETQVEKDPVSEIIQNDEEVREILSDPKVQAFLHHLQTSGGADVHYVMQYDQYLAEKLKILIHKGVLNVQSQMP